jgi:hypothetical protein
MTEIKDLPNYLEKAGEIINPIRCKTIFERISHEVSDTSLRFDIFRIYYSWIWTLQSPDPNT